MSNNSSRTIKEWADLAKKELIKEALSSSNKVSKNSLIEKIVQVGGGCIHNAWCIHFQNGKKVFAKSNHIDNINMFKFERECLSILKRFANESYIWIPKPLDLISYQSISLLVLEWMDLKQCQQNLLGKRRLAHVLGMYGTILFWEMATCHDGSATSTSASNVLDEKINKWDKRFSTERIKCDSTNPRKKSLKVYDICKTGCLYVNNDIHDKLYFGKMQVGIKAGTSRTKTKFLYFQIH